MLNRMVTSRKGQRETEVKPLEQLWVKGLALKGPEAEFFPTLSL